MDKDIALIIMNGYVDDIIRENKIMSTLESYNIWVNVQATPLGTAVEKVLEKISPGLCSTLCYFVADGEVELDDVVCKSVSEIYDWVVLNIKPLRYTDA